MIGMQVRIVSIFTKFHKFGHMVFLFAFVCLLVMSPLNSHQRLQIFRIPPKIVLKNPPFDCRVFLLRA